MNILFWTVMIVLFLFSCAMLWSLCEVASKADEWIEDYLAKEKENDTNA